MAEEPTLNFKLSVEYLDHCHVVKIITQGDITLEANSQIVAAAIDAEEKFNVHRFLVDDRLATIKMNTVDIHDLPTHNQFLGVNENWRVALLYTPDEKTHRVFQFYENRSYIVGIQQRVFTNEQEALDWLTESANNSPI